LLSVLGDSSNFTRIASAMSLAAADMAILGITQADLATVTERVRRRVIRWFRLTRLLDATAAAESPRDRERAGASNSRRLSFSTGSRLTARPPPGATSCSRTTTGLSFKHHPTFLHVIDIHSL